MLKHPQFDVLQYKAFENPMHGKIMEFHKKDIFMEKSWSSVLVIRIF